MLHGQSARRFSAEKFREISPMNMSPIALLLTAGLRPTNQPVAHHGADHA